MPISKTGTYKDELEEMFSMIKCDEHFAFCRFGDGEMSIIKNKGYKASKPIRNPGQPKRYRKEFNFDPREIDKFSDSRKALIQSFKYKEKKYFIGVECPYCHKGSIKRFRKTLDIAASKKDDEFTYAYIFVNSNYPRALELMNEVMPTKKIIAVVPQDSTKYPYPLYMKYCVGENAWINDCDLINRMKEDITDKNLKGHVYLIQAGPFANIIIHELWKFNKENTYIDIGSILDPEIGIGKTRGYLRGKWQEDKCHWEPRNTKKG